MTPQNRSTLETLKDLRVVVYKELHIRADVFDATTVDDWIASPNLSLEDVERVCNHIHISDYIQGVSNREELEAIAGDVADAWGQRLKEIDRRYTVRLFDDFGLQITFFLAR